MGFQYHHLEDADVRQKMAELWSAEWEDMHSSGHPRDCYGKRLTDGQNTSPSEAAFLSGVKAWVKG